MPPGARRRSSRALAEQRIAASVAAALPAVAPALRPGRSPRAPAGAALLRALSALVFAIRANEPGVRMDHDPRFLHALRVAVRRARGLLTQPRRVFRERDVQRWRDGLKALQHASDPLRDIDTLLAWLHEEQQRGAAGTGLDRLAAQFRRLRAREHRRLLAFLDSDEHESSLRELLAFLGRAPGRSARGARAGRPIAAVLHRRAVRLLRRIRAQGRRLAARGSSEGFHELRKDVKKLRYLLDGTPPAFREKRVRPVLKQLQRLQRELGVVQDARVHGDLLQKARARAGRLVPRLIRRLDERSRRARRRALARLEPLERLDLGGLLRDVR
jgi:CHAD domain-containing protein